MIIFEVETDTREGLTLQDNIITELVVYNSLSQQVTHFVNEDCLHTYLIDVEEKPSEDTDRNPYLDTLLAATTPSSSGSEFEFKGETYQEDYQLISLDDIPDKLVSLINQGDDPQRLISSYPVDSGLLLGGLDIPFLEDGLLAANPEFLDALGTLIDFSSIMEFLNMDVDSLYAEEVPVGLRLVGIEKILSTINNIL